MTTLHSEILETIHTLQDKHTKATRHNKCNINNTSDQNALCLKSFATHLLKLKLIKFEW